MWNSNEPGHWKPASTRFARQRTLLSTGSGGGASLGRNVACTHKHSHMYMYEYTSYGFFIESSQGSHMEPMQMPVSEQADVNVWPLLSSPDTSGLSGICFHFTESHTEVLRG